MKITVQHEFFIFQSIQRRCPTTCKKLRSATWHFSKIKAKKKTDLHGKIILNLIILL
jgi:hypothetical protein